MIKKIAILTSGGDAPGMNNAVRAIAKSAKANGIEPFVVMAGYKGLHEGNIVSADKIDLDGSVSKGGTIIYSARYPEFKEEKVREEAKEQLNKLGIDALVVIGGDGSYQGAQLLHEMGIKTIALPGTIDNDITSSDFTIGYDTALNTIVDAAEKIRDTMNSHNRAAIIEVMGHGTSDLALFSALAIGAELVVSIESKKTPDEIAEIIKEQIITRGKRSVIVIISEMIFEDLKELEKEVSKKSGVVTRTMTLGHLQRGGKPSARERIDASLMGMAAIEELVKGNSGLAIGILKGEITGTPILQALEIPRKDRKMMANKINNLNQI